MITLNDYLNRPIITQELFNIFEEFINSTYNENVLCESLLFEGVTRATKEKWINAATNFVTSLTSVRRQIIFQLNHLDDIINDNIRKDVKTQYQQYANEYNKLIPNYVKDKFVKQLRTDSTDKIDITKIVNAFSSDLYKYVKKNNDDTWEHTGQTELNEFNDKIAEFDYKTEQRIEKSEEKRKAKEYADAMSNSAKKDEKLENILKDYVAAVDEWETKLDNLEEWKSWNKDIGNEYKEQLAILSQVQANTVINIKNGDEKALQNFIKKKKEYCEYISGIIKQLEDEEQNLTIEFQKQVDAAAETPEDAAVTPEVQQTAETESDIIKNELVKKVASEVNIDVVALGKLYVQITKQLSKQNKLTKEMLDTIANTNDNNAIIGLNLMLLGAVTTQNLPNRSKIISEYCSVIQKSIEKKNYDKIFNKASKKESK